jgi:hypothetical protein
VHGRPSAYKRTGGRKVYDFIGRVGQLSLRQFDVDAAACIIIIIILCVYIYIIICTYYTRSAQHSRRAASVSGRVVVWSDGI